MERILYISDLDGTLLNGGQEISDRSAEILNRLIQKGLLFTYATARSFTSAKEVTRKLRLSLPVATYNGTFLVVPSDGRAIDRRTMDREATSPILNLLRAKSVYPLVYALINGEERVSWVRGRENEGISQYLNSRVGDRRLRAVNDYDELFAGEIFNITVIGEESAVRALDGRMGRNERVYRTIQEEIYHRGEFWLEIYHKDATKAHALQRLKEYTGASEVVCFGDNINDLSMFSAANRCFAVSNAAREVIAAATGVIASNEQDGVAEYLLGIYSSNSCWF